MLGIYCRTSVEKEFTIERQKENGINFCIANNFEYQIYIDEGKSGFKIEDSNDPFKNRPSFTSLINDIENLKITQVWVSDHERLSRNEIASGLIFYTFGKFNIELYENNILIDFKSPENKLKRQMMDAFAEYARQKIVDKTTDGAHKAINNRGRVGIARIFGYEKAGRNYEGKMRWEPVDKEINILKIIYERVLKGDSFRKASDILLEISQDNKKILNEKQALRYATKISRFVKNYKYTGYQLKTEGMEILKKYDNFEIDDISALQDMKYWIKSAQFHLELVSIPDWIKCIERRHYNKSIKKDNHRRANSDLATGIIKCSVCGYGYYAYNQKNTLKNGTISYYHNYKHHPTISRKNCKQRPTTILIEKIDEIFKVYFFFYYLIYNESNTFVKETLEKIRHQTQTIETQIKSNKTDIGKIERRLKKLGDKLSDFDDEDISTVIKLISSTDKELEEKKKNNSELNYELAQLNYKYDKTEMENTYINIKEKILKFYSMEIEEQRSELLKIIKACLIFGHYILIDAGNVIFIFDIRINCKFDTSLLDNLDKDKIFKNYFMSNTNKKAKEYLIPEPNEMTEMNDGDNLFIDFDLKDKQDNFEAQGFLEDHNINYDISKHDRFTILY